MFPLQQLPHQRFISWWNEFFHSRITHNSDTFRYISYLRIIYGLCLLYDRIILSFDYQMFFLYHSSPSLQSSSSSSAPSSSWQLPLILCNQYMIPVAATMSDVMTIDTTLPSSPLCTIASYFPINYYNTIFVFYHVMGIIHIILLLFNIYPKVQLLLIHINMLSYHYHTELLWDGEDVMFKLWNIFFLLLPLSHQYYQPSKNNNNNTNINTKMNDKPNTTPIDSSSASSVSYSSYPMWPIRLFQIELCCIYAGAGYAKLSTTVWRSGNAMYHIIHEKDFFGGPYVPEFIFHRYGPLKLATWSSLFLECSCIILVWSSNKYIKYSIVISMIALHIGIELTMNMHVFEILSIIGWCMFFFEPNMSYTEYYSSQSTTNRKISASSTTGSSSHTDVSENNNSISRYSFFYIMQHMWFINLFLLCIISILIIDTFPLYQLYTILESVFAVPLLQLYNSSINVNSTSPSKLSFIYGCTVGITKVQKVLLDLYDFRRAYYFTYIMKYLYPIGLYQEVWNLYSGAPDTNCIFTTNVTTYDTTGRRQSYSYVSPDWGTMTWYMKKRYQRPMTMQEKLSHHMCFDCYVRYHTNNIIKDVLVKETDVPTTRALMNPNNMQLASALLTVQCENPPDPPIRDDWYNWSGWFYANAKQDVLIQHDSAFLYSTNVCNDLNIELCQQYHNEGSCTTAHENHSYRHGTNNGTVRTDHDAFVYNITQTCRVSCNFCPEHGYDISDLINGTRLTIFWPIPTWDNTEQMYIYDPTAIYYDGTIVQVRDHPLKQYLIRYDIPGYKNEWFDPMILRDRGYHFIPQPTLDVSSTDPNDTVDNNEYNDDDIIGNDDDDDDDTEDESNRDEL